MGDDWDLPEQPKPPSDDAVREAEEFAEELDHMVNCSSDRRGRSYPFAFAEDTLLGIAEGVRKTGRVSEGQRRAVNNIRRSKGWEEI